MIKRIVLAAVMFIIVLLFGCTTAAQRQASFIRENSQAVKQKVLAYAHNVETNPNYLNIAIHMPLVISVTTHPNILQLADNGMPNDEDIRAIILLCHDKPTPRLASKLIRAVIYNDGIPYNFEKYIIVR